MHHDDKVHIALKHYGALKAQVPSASETIAGEVVWKYTQGSGVTFSRLNTEKLTSCWTCAQHLTFPTVTVASGAVGPGAVTL